VDTAHTHTPRRGSFPPSCCDAAFMLQCGMAWCNAQYCDATKRAMQWCNATLCDATYLCCATQHGATQQGYALFHVEQLCNRFLLL